MSLGRLNALGGLTGAASSRAPISVAQHGVLLGSSQLGKQTRLNVAVRAQRSRKGPKSKAPKKRGPKPSTVGDSMQALDESVLDEFRKMGAAEQAARAQLPKDEEADPKRYNFHRVLLKAASRGLTEQAEETLGQMARSGLPPGPRAYHALAFSYVRAKQPYEALEAARRAAEEGLKLLPETFVVLIYSLLNHADPADVEAAQEVLESMELQAEQQGLPVAGFAAPGWLMLCKELFRKGAVGEAMSAVKRGYDGPGYVADPELAGSVIEQLAKAGLKERAWKEVDSLVALGFKAAPEHYNPLIRAEAASGAWRRARKYVLEAFARPTWSPPNAATFNALLRGMIASLDPATGLPVGPGATSDDGDSYYSSMEAPGEDPKDRVAKLFARVREEMLLYGLRPDAGTYATFCEGYTKLGALDEALGALQSMTESGGTTRMLSRKKVAKLLVTLAEEDRPADLLNVLKALVSFNQKIPRAATRALEGRQGTTLATAWVPAHLEYMRTHPATGRSQSGGVAQQSLRALVQQALETQEYDGVALSSLGGACVGEGGVWAVPTKMTTHELETELRVAGMLEEGLKYKRGDLTKLVKERRKALPRTVLDVQEHLVAVKEAEEEMLARKGGVTDEEATKKKKKKEKVEKKRFRVLTFEDGKLAKIQHVVQEVASRNAAYSAVRGGSSPYDDPMMTRKKGGGDDDEDELSDIMKEGVDEGVGAIIRSDDTVFGEDESTVAEGAEDGEEGMGGMQESDSFFTTIDVIEARMLNRTAGMSIAFEVLRCWELLGGVPTGPDLEALVAGAVAEGNADVAVELADRLPSLLRMGYSSQAVGALYSQLATACLNSIRANSADLVLERAEDAGLQPFVDPVLYPLLTKALNGRPRHRELARAQMEDMTEDASVADIIRDESIEAAEGEEDEGEDGQTKSRSRTPSQSGADDDEEEDEDDGDVFDLDAEDDEYARAYSGLGPAKQAGDASKAGSGARKGYGDDDAEAAKEAAEADAARKAVEEGGWGARTQAGEVRTAPAVVEVVSRELLERIVSADPVLADPPASAMAAEASALATQLSLSDPLTDLVAAAAAATAGMEDEEEDEEDLEGGPSPAQLQKLQKLVAKGASVGEAMVELGLISQDELDQSGLFEDEDEEETEEEQRIVDELVAMFGAPDEDPSKGLVLSAAAAGVDPKAGPLGQFLEEGGAEELEQMTRELEEWLAAGQQELEPLLSTDRPVQEDTPLSNLVHMLQPHELEWLEKFAEDPVGVYDSLPDRVPAAQGSGRGSGDAGGGTQGRRGGTPRPRAGTPKPAPKR